MASSERENGHPDSPKLYCGIQPQNLKRSEDLKSIQLQHPGFDYSFIDRDGNPSLKGLLQMAGWVEEVVLGSEIDKTLFSLDWHDSGDLIFISIIEMNVSKVIYEKNFSNANLMCRAVCTGVGRSSMTLVIDLLVKNEAEPILRVSNQTVNVDPYSRKAKPWPLWIRDKFKGSSAPRSRSNPFSRPQESFVQQVIVCPSDTDYNGHCSFATYARYADDTLRTALRLRHDEKTASHHSATHGNPSPVNLSSEEDFVSQFGSPSAALKGISQQVVMRGVSNFKINFFQECHEGQRLNVHIWQDDAKDSIVYCSIERKNEVICQIVMEYFASLSKL